MIFMVQVKPVTLTCIDLQGCPIPYYYGEDCSLPCQDRCMDSRCHIYTGHCFGCKA